MAGKDAKPAADAAADAAADPGPVKAGGSNRSRKMTGQRRGKPVAEYTVKVALTRAGRHYRQGEKIALGAAEAAPLKRAGAID